MTNEGFKRKLTAIFSADAVGYSRLMAENEAATVKTIATYREVMTSLIKQHRGRVVDSPGDNLLAEFSSVVDAVQCAVAVQNEFQTRNAELAENRRMEFRIGINLGDVIDEEGRIYGDGVNIAARLESMADPGGICVSKTVFDQIETKLPLGYGYLGEKSIKNIPKQVCVYKVLMEPEAVGKVIGKKRFLGRYSRKTAIASIIVLLMVAGVLIGWNIYLQQSKKVEPASFEKMAFPLPEKPSIAVMPFVNLSGDPEQEYLADSISENLISSLSQLPKVFVIARGSMFAYKGKAVKVKQVSEELGVQYVVEGSVQRSGDRIRIAAQLIDAIKGYYVWGDRFDRDLTDIFALQDDISLNILKAIQLEVPKVFSAGLGRGTNHLQAYLKLLQGYDHFRAIPENFDQKELKLAKGLFEESIALDQEYTKAYVMLGFAYLNEVFFGWSKSPEKSFAKALELANKSLALNPDDAGGHALLSFFFLYTGQHGQAIAESKQALEIDPYAAVLEIAGIVFTYSGLFEEAIAVYEKLMRLNPYAPEHIYDTFINAYFLVGNFEKSIPICMEAVKRWPNGYVGYQSLAMAYSALDRKEDALQAIAEFKKAHPDYTPEHAHERMNWYLNSLPFKNQSDRDRLKKLITKAGLYGDVSQADAE